MVNYGPLPPKNDLPPLIHRWIPQDYVRKAVVQFLMPFSGRRRSSVRPLRWYPLRMGRACRQTSPGSPVQGKRAATSIWQVFNDNAALFFQHPSD